jgi:RNA polymerase sigma-70 factor (ECF subfamily)
MSNIFINIPDEELIKGCLKQEEKYFSMIYQKYFRKMFHLCKRYAINKEEAEDLAQEGFIIVYRQLKKFEFRGSFEGWMRRIMVNNAINYIRVKKKLSFIESTEDMTLQSDPEDFSTSNDEIRDHISSDVLMKMISELPDAYRMIFNMYAIDGFSHREISEALKIKESTSRANLTKARLKLKKSVEDILIKERATYA